MGSVGGARRGDGGTSGLCGWCNAAPTALRGARPRWVPSDRMGGGAGPSGSTGHWRRTGRSGPTQQPPVVDREPADHDANPPGFRNPSQRSVATRDSDGGAGLTRSQDDSTGPLNPFKFKGQPGTLAGPCIRAGTVPRPTAHTRPHWQAALPVRPGLRAECARPASGPAVPDAAERRSRRRGARKGPGALALASDGARAHRGGGSVSGRFICSSWSPSVNRGVLKPVQICLNKFY